MSFWHGLSNRVSSVMGAEYCPVTPKRCATAHEMVTKRETDEFLAPFLKSCFKSHGPRKSPRDPKMISNRPQNGHKTRKRRVLGTIFQTVPSVTGPEIRHVTPKQCAIAHEMVKKQENDEFSTSYLK